MGNFLRRVATGSIRVKMARMYKPILSQIAFGEFVLVQSLQNSFSSKSLLMKAFGWGTRIKLNSLYQDL